MNGDYNIIPQENHYKAAAIAAFNFLNSVHKALVITDCVVENVLYTAITFRTPEDVNTDKYITVRTRVLSNYFVDNYKHLGITPINVMDFLKKEDVKYKVSKEDIKNFLIDYLYGSKNLLNPTPDFNNDDNNEDIEEII